MLKKAASATDRMAKHVVTGVRQGVVDMSKKAAAQAAAVPRKVESKRAKRKIKWLEGRGYVETRRENERYECGTYRGLSHVVDD
jgi:hypothetical protein